MASWNRWERRYADDRADAGAFGSRDWIAGDKAMYDAFELADEAEEKKCI